MHSELYAGNCYDISSDNKFSLDKVCVHIHTNIAEKKSVKNDSAISIEVLNDQPHILPTDDNEQVNVPPLSSSGLRFVAAKQSSDLKHFKIQ